MNPMVDWLNHVSVVWSTHVFHATWQSAAVSGVLLAAVGLGRRWPAPWRYCLLLLALVKFAFPPLLPVPIGLFSQAGPTVTSPNSIQEIARHSTPDSTQISSILAAFTQNDQCRSERELGRDE